MKNTNLRFNPRRRQHYANAEAPNLNFIEWLIHKQIEKTNYDTMAIDPQLYDLMLANDDWYAAERSKAIDNLVAMGWAKPDTFK